MAVAEVLGDVVHLLSITKMQGMDPNRGAKPDYLKIPLAWESIPCIFID